MPKIVQIIDGVASDTRRFTASDAATALPANYVVQNNRHARFATITVETNDLRIALGGTAPTQGGAAVGHLIKQGDALQLETQHEISSLLYINAVAATNCVFQITLLF